MPKGIHLLFFFILLIGQLLFSTINWASDENFHSREISDIRLANIKRFYIKDITAHCELLRDLSNTEIYDPQVYVYPPANPLYIYQKKTANPSSFVTDRPIQEGSSLISSDSWKFSLSYSEKVLPCQIDFIKYCTFSDVHQDDQFLILLHLKKVDNRALIELVFQKIKAEGTIWENITPNFQTRLDNAIT